MIDIPEAYAPLFQPARYKVFWGGRGAARSWSFARALLALAARTPLLVLCAREYQTSLKESVYLLLKQQIAKMGLDAHYEVLGSEIRGINGSRFIFEGIKNNVDRIKSIEGIDIAWVEEAAKVSSESWGVLIPTVRKAGSEIWVSFNTHLPHDPTYQRFVVSPPPGSIIRKVSYRDNPWFSAELRAEMEHLKATDFEAYLNVWEGELKVLAEGAIYGKQLLQARKDKRICAVPVEASVVVDTFWDLGRNDLNAIWFMQSVGPQKRFIDYYENRLLDLEHYARILKGRATDEEMQKFGISKEVNERRQRYNYGRHFLPHDVEAQMLGMSKTRKKQLEDMGIKPIEVVSRVPVLMEGIEATRAMFPSCWFDEVHCKDGLSALSNYAWSLNEDTNTFSQTPIHNWASNGADAFRQCAQGFKTKTERKPLPRVNTGQFV